LQEGDYYIAPIQEVVKHARWEKEDLLKMALSDEARKAVEREMTKLNEQEEKAKEWAGLSFHEVFLKSQF
jgi:hypothetical protein